MTTSHEKAALLPETASSDLSYLGIHTRLDLEGKVRDLALLTWLWTVTSGL